MQSARNISSCQGASRADALSLARISVMLLSAGFASASFPASAQVAGPASQAATALPDAIKQREQELEATRVQQKSSAELQQQLKAEVAAIGQDRSKLNGQLIDVAAQVRAVETRIGEAEARLRPLDAREKQIRSSLELAPLRSRGSAGGVAARRTANAASPAGQARRRVAVASNRNIARLRRARVACPRRSPRQGPR